jgi:hypothetical protein
MTETILLDIRIAGASESQCAIYCKLYSILLYLPARTSEYCSILAFFSSLDHQAIAGLTVRRGLF